MKVKIGIRGKNKVMTREEVISKLKLMFIERYDIGVGVGLKQPITIDHCWDGGYAWLTKIRWMGEKKGFEWYRDGWDCGWKSDQKPMEDHAFEIFPDALDVEIETRTEYFIDDLKSERL